MTRYEDFNDKTEGRVIEVYYDLVLESLEKEGILTSEERFYLSELEVQEEVVFYKKQCDGITVNTAIGTECNYYVACFVIRTQLYMYFFESFIRKIFCYPYDSVGSIMADTANISKTVRRGRIDVGNCSVSIVK